MSRSTKTNEELNLLAEALSTQGESEGDGVKYIYMDEVTVYRFENNRMKKVSAAMLKKANKLLETQGNLPNDTPEKLRPKQPKQTKQTKRKQAPPPSDDEDNSIQPDVEEEEIPEPKPKKTAKKVTTTRVPKTKASDSANIDLNEYYNNKNKMEYMSLEIDRLTNKVNKLKQYKSIVNKITGGEYDPPDVPVYSQPQQQQQQLQQSRQVNDSLFAFTGY